MDDLTTTVPIVSSDGNHLFRVEVRSFSGREPVSIQRGFSQDELRKPIEAIAQTVMGIFQTISPAKATAEFEVEMAVESGQFIALLCKASGKANLKVTLEWNGAPPGMPTQLE